MSLGTGFFVVGSLSPATSSGSAFGIGAATNCPVIVGRTVSPIVDVGTCTVAVVTVSLAGSVANVVYVDAMPLSISSLNMIWISCTGGLLGTG